MAELEKKREMQIKKRDLRIFISSVFFVLGFSLVFSVFGVLLQTLLSGVAHSTRLWLGRLGGALIILFGLYVAGLIKLPALAREYKIRVNKKFSSKYITSFVFGAAFAIGWTPCIGPVLGAIITLAATQPSIAFILMLSYSIGLGIPFLLVGYFTNESKNIIRKSTRWVKHINQVFGVILVILGLLVFTNQLALLANFAFASEFLSNLNLSTGMMLGTSTLINIGIAFFAGIISFLSPCVLPIIPGFLSYLVTTVMRK